MLDTDRIREITKREIGLALLFSVPPGVGVAGFLNTASSSLLLGLIGGFTTFLTIFILMIVVFITGSESTEKENEKEWGW